LARAYGSRFDGFAGSRAGGHAAQASLMAGDICWERKMGLSIDHDLAKAIEDKLTLVALEFLRGDYSCLRRGTRNWKFRATERIESPRDRVLSLQLRSWFAPDYRARWRYRGSTLSEVPRI